MGSSSVSLNGCAVALCYFALDPPPFTWLTGASSMASLYLVVLILTAQRGDDRLTQRRELPNLELTILTEQKIAKVVALLEELRQDSHHLRDRVDEQAQVMARPADPQSVIRRDQGDAFRVRACLPQGRRRPSALGNFTGTECDPEPNGLHRLDASPSRR
jgi:uncharacterized membrane protein